MEKQQLELLCNVHWPCAINHADLSPNTWNPGVGGLFPDYEPKPETICPSDWTYNPSNGNCDALETYKGTCPRHVNMLGYTAGMKAHWARACNAGWPLTKRKLPP